MDKLQQILETLEAASARQKYRRIDFFTPYVKQALHIARGAKYRERLLIAGNQNGKTITGGYEMAVHLTGEYPPDWKGRKWDKPIKAWACGETGVLTRDVQQKYLCGEPGVEDAWGTGMIPKAALLDKSLARGVTDAYDTVQVEHKTNGVVDGISIVRFKSYEQGRTKFQGDSIDIVWCDEEPPMDIYSEILTRLTATDGSAYITFTPLKGRSEVVIRFMDEKDPTRIVTTMTIEDALHIPAAKRAAIIAAWPSYEREARAHGVPMLGSGRIFQTSEENIKEPALEYIPPHWYKLWGIDFGIGHPFAAVLGLWDKDNDVIHIHHCYRQADALPIMHCAAMKPIGAAVPVAWPQDGTARESSGEPLQRQYKKHGLLMLPEHATWEDGGISTEAGIVEMQERMETGRLKIAAQLSDWFEEYREYHRKDGKIVKVRDDLMSATRILIMAKRHARLAVLGGRRIFQGSKPRIADGVDEDGFGA